jgi:hypothetical protein
VQEGYGTEWVAFDEVQAAYERVMLAGGGVGDLLGLVKEVVVAGVLGWWRGTGSRGGGLGWGIKGKGGVCWLMRPWWAD